MEEMGRSGVGFDQIVRRLVARLPAQGVTIIGVTGAVAAGKSTFAATLERALATDGRRVALASTDGFLFPNAILEARGLSLRKGFPESYDVAALTGALTAIRAGPAEFPGYSHARYDVDPALARWIGPVDVLILEGLGLHAAPPLTDILIYLDAAEADLQGWYVDRFVGLWRAGAGEEGNFYARFAGQDEAAVRAFAAQVWQAINLPNLRAHIIGARQIADLVIAKRADHGFASVMEAGWGTRART